MVLIWLIKNKKRRIGKKIKPLDGTKGLINDKIQGTL